MDDYKNTIIATLEAIRHPTVMRMIHEIVRWLADHQDDLI